MNVPHISFANGCDEADLAHALSGLKNCVVCVVVVGLPNYPLGAIVEDVLVTDVHEDGIAILDEMNGVAVTIPWIHIAEVQYQ